MQIKVPKMYLGVYKEAVKQKRAAQAMGYDVNIFTAMVEIAKQQEKTQREFQLPRFRI